MVDFEFSGLMAATFAPFDSNCELNLDLVADYAAFLARNGVKGVYVNGTTGEGVFSLTVSERIQLAEAWMKEKDTIPTIIIQVGGCAFLDAQKLAAHAETIGATAIATLPNMFHSPRSEEELVNWVANIASAAPSLPVLYYHYPKLSRVEIPMPGFMKAAAIKIPNFVGLKFTSRDCGEAGSCLLLKRPNGKPFHFLFGSDETYLGHFTSGMGSAIGSSYNFAPQLYHKINQALASGDLASAQKLQSVVTRMFDALFKNGNPGFVQQKVAMKILCNLDFGPARFPQVPMRPEHVLELEKDLLELGIDKYHI